MTSRYLRKKEERKQGQKLTFKIDCKETVEDLVIDIQDFDDFLRKRIKVHGKKGNLGDKVSVQVSDKNKLLINAEAPFSKRYLKYLTKKYLKKNNIRDYLRVVSNEKNGYQLRYFNIQNDEAEGDE